MGYTDGRVRPFVSAGMFPDWKEILFHLKWHGYDSFDVSNGFSLWEICFMLIALYHLFPWQSGDMVWDCIIYLGGSFLKLDFHDTCSVQARLSRG